MKHNRIQQPNGAHDPLELDLEPAPRQPREKNLSETIAFRLNPEFFALLTQRAEFQGMRFHQYARALVIESLLRDASEQSVSSMLEKLHHDTDGLRGDIAFFMKTIHMTIGRMSEKDADEWVKRNFKR